MSKQITVIELIELLKPLSGDALVWVAGCDCVGEAIGVSFDNEENTVMIER